MQIELRRLTKRFGHLVALDDLNLRLVPGQVVALLGPNGAGKTTLLHLLAGAARCEAGEIRLDGAIFDRDRADLRKRLVYLPDLPPVVPNWTVLRYLGVLLELYEVPRDGLPGRVVEILRELELLEVAEWSFSLLSRGQIHKAFLAGAILSDPELWLLDEPFASGMDPAGLNAFKRHARAAAARGHTIVYSTQVLEVAERFADRLCVLHRGRLQFFGSLGELPQRGEASALEALFQSLKEYPAP